MADKVRYTAVNLTREAKHDLDMLCVALSGVVQRRLTLSETLTVARTYVEQTIKGA
jgi:hypothetical protein